MPGVGAKISIQMQKILYWVPYFVGLLHALRRSQTPLAQDNICKMCDELSSLWWFKLKAVQLCCGISVLQHTPGW